MRLYPIVFSSIPITVLSNDAKVNGYNIPKGSTIIGNIGYIQRCKLYWKYPNTFNIDNFLSESGKFKKNPAFCSFGYES